MRPNPARADLSRQRPEPGLTPGGIVSKPRDSAGGPTPDGWATTTRPPASTDTAKPGGFTMPPTNALTIGQWGRSPECGRPPVTKGRPGAAANVRGWHSPRPLGGHGNAGRLGVEW